MNVSMNISYCGEPCLWNYTWRCTYVWVYTEVELMTVISSSLLQRWG